MRSRIPRLPSPAMAVSLLALSIALGGTAYAATGGTFVLGGVNSASTSTTLTSTSTTGPALAITNSGGKPAARFVSNAGVPPIQVSNETKVPKLNADRLDGLDSTSFALASVASGHFQALQPDANGAWDSYGAGMLDVMYTCPDVLTSNGTFYVHNGSASDVMLFIDSGLDNPTFMRLQSGSTAFLPALAAGDSFDVQAHGDEGDLVLDVATAHDQSLAACLIETQAVFTH